MAHHSRPITASVAGGVGVLLIHAFIVLSFVLALSVPSPRYPNATGVGATAVVSSAVPDMTVVFIDEPTPAETTPPPRPPALASRGTTPPDVQLVVLSADPSPASASTKAEDSADTKDDIVAPTDAAEHARLYGRYLGQLQARIERAWMRPRTEIGAPEFACRVRIQQGRRGYVVSVALDRCNGTDRWQQSLLSAIRTASPLPAPPDASVYEDVIWLTFASQSFQEGGSPQGFEPETRLADTSDRQVLGSFQQFVSGTSDDPQKGGKPTSNVVHLTIIGGPQTSSPAASRVEPESLPPEPKSSDALPQ